MLDRSGVGCLLGCDLASRLFPKFGLRSAAHRHSLVGLSRSASRGLDSLAASCANSRTASGQWCGRATTRIPVGRPLLPLPVQLTGLVGNAVCIVAAAGVVASGAVSEWSRIAVRRAAMAKRS